jgi:MtN3 and saliva related transmembrane protein
VSASVVFTWIGYAAGTLTTIAYLPQVLHVWKTKRAEDLHIGTLVSLIAGVALWLLYGLLTHQPPVTVANAVSLALQIPILVLKLRYARGSGERQ